MRQRHEYAKSRLVTVLRSGKYSGQGEWGQTVTTAKAMGWEELNNGDLLRSA
jgi:hypothetical protein